MTNLKFAYFGGEPLGVTALEELKACGFLPGLIVTNPDRPAGRGHKLTPPPMKEWGLQHELPIWQPEDIRVAEDTEKRLSPYDLLVVVAYSKILPQALINRPKFGTLNLHPSLLPLYRGASPIRSAILEDNRAAVGVSIMLMDEKMDNGPILAQKAMPIADENWPVDGRELDTALARLGGALLATVIPDWVAGKITPTEQDHSVATYCSKFDKSIGELKIDPKQLPTGKIAKEMLHKIKALAGSPGTFFRHGGKRFKITEAELTPGGTLNIKRIILSLIHISEPTRPY